MNYQFKQSKWQTEIKNQDKELKGNISLQEFQFEHKKCFCKNKKAKNSFQLHQSLQYCQQGSGHGNHCTAKDTRT
jgi:hypothetical protein